jgi:hypothetical protein
MNIHSALFLITKNWKQPELSPSWCMDKLYIHTAEYHSAIRNKQLLCPTWPNHECIVLSERSQAPEAPHCVIPSMSLSRKDTPWHQSTHQWLPGMGTGAETDHKGAWGSLGEPGNSSLSTWCGDDINVYVCQNSQNQIPKGYI